MNRLLSVLSRRFDRDLAQDLCAGAAMAAFLMFAILGSAGVSALVAAWRVGQ